MKRLVAALAAFAVAGCGTQHSSAPRTSTAAAETAAWCPKVRSVAEAMQAAHEAEASVQNDEANGASVAVHLTDLHAVIDSYTKAHTINETVVANPPPAIAPAFNTFTTTKPDTVSVSGRQRLAAAEHDISAYVAKTCDVTYDPAQVRSQTSDASTSPNG